MAIVLYPPETKGIADFSLRVALQTLLKEYMEVTKSPMENKMYGLLETRPRRKARKYLYAIGACFCFVTVRSLYTYCPAATPGGHRL